MDDGKSLFAKERIEIQVASLLMHAWSEVQHDLVYKQKKGIVTLDEHESLDEINGLVLAGELSLRRLQRTTEMRLSAENKPFSNHYLLASFIYNEIEKEQNESFELGDVETLFSVLQKTNRLTPGKLRNDLKKVDHSDSTPIAQQLLDIIAGDKANILRFVVQEKDYKAHGQKLNETNDAMIGKYLRAWIDLEKTIDQLLQKLGYTSQSNHYKNAYKYLSECNLLSTEELQQYMYIKRTRNTLVHGIEPIDSQTLKEQIYAIHEIKGKLLSKEEKDSSDEWHSLDE